MKIVFNYCEVHEPNFELPGFLNKIKASCHVTIGELGSQIWLSKSNLEAGLTQHYEDALVQVAKHLVKERIASPTGWSIFFKTLIGRQPNKEKVMEATYHALFDEFDVVIQHKDIQALVKRTDGHIHLAYGCPRRALKGLF